MHRPVSLAEMRQRACVSPWLYRLMVRFRGDKSLVVEPTYVKIASLYKSRFTRER